MGIGTAELYNNLGLCCFFAQQYDMTLTCFQVSTPYPTSLPPLIPPYHLTNIPKPHCIPTQDYILHNRQS